MNSIVNIAGYLFVELDRLATRRQALLDHCVFLQIKGTILLSPEGVNLFLAGERAAITELLAFLRNDPCLADLSVKESLSDEQPFRRMLVRIKKEIIAFGVDGISPAVRTSPKLKPSELKSWLDQGREVTLLDVRNTYEIEVGTFQGAVSYDIDHFRQFPDAVLGEADAEKQKPVVMFCTGGIRCEKAGPLMEQAGYQNVYQLDGGILQYFEDCGGAHYQGDCFVFDQRVAVDPELKETEATVCFRCQHVVFPADLDSPLYVPGESCPYCYLSAEQSMAETIAARKRGIQQATTPLPGSLPYDNVRPMNVPLRFDKLLLHDFLCQFHPHLLAARWLAVIDGGHLSMEGTVLDGTHRVRAGQRINHHIPSTTEPDVNPQIDVLYEDDALVVVNKPAPLPMHPSGRFNRNTLISILNSVYSIPLRIVHRLDANTSGIMVFCKGKQNATCLQAQFLDQQVEKEYLVMVNDCPQLRSLVGAEPGSTFVVDRAIATGPDLAGSRKAGKDGKKAVTEFVFVEQMPQDRVLLLARPRTGRTNQIRVHLWSEGIPISGDPTYGPNQTLNEKQTLHVKDPPMCLHAQSIRFQHPKTGATVQYTAPRPIWVT